MKRKKVRTEKKVNGVAWVAIIGAVVVVALFLISGSSVQLSPKNFKKVLLGDANSDGQVNVGDVILILQYVQDRSTVIDLDAADFNEDGKVTELDAHDLLVDLFSGSGSGEVLLGPGGSSTPIVCSDQFIRGDSNSDSSFSIADMVYSLNSLFVFGSPAPECIDRADTNDDEVFDVSDVIYGLAALFIPGSPPPPGPVSGGLPIEGYDEQAVAGWSLCDGIDQDGDGWFNEGEPICGFLPDLVVSSIDINSVIVWPANLTTVQYVANLTILVSNIGLSDASSVSFARVTTNPTSSVEMASTPTIPVGESVEATALFIVPAGIYDVTAEADFWQNVSEMSETNNDLTVSITVP